jgi:hypothetical protein
MNDAVENFLSAHFPITGLGAYSLHLPDHAPSTHSFSKSLEPTVAEQMLSGLVKSAQSLFPAEQRVSRCCWSFECVRVYVAARADGACLALLIEDDVNLDRERLQQTMQAFLGIEEI